MKAAFCAKWRQFRYLAKQVERLRQSGKFDDLPAAVRQHLLRKLRSRLRKIRHFFSKSHIQKALSGLALLLAAPLGQQVQAQWFAAPVPNPFGLTTAAVHKYLAFADIDADGDLDLFTKSYDEKIYFLENTGTAATPVFPAAGGVINPFGIELPAQSIYPVFADIDQDGDLDMFLGSTYHDYFGYTRISLLENTGTAVNPAFGPFQHNPFGTFLYSNHSTPAFVDIESDGDFDLLIMGEYQNSALYKNIGTPQAPAFSLSSLSSYGISPAIGPETTVKFADFDADGDSDLLVRHQMYTCYYGNCAYYNPAFYFEENAGSPTNPDFAPPVIAPFGLTGLDNLSTPPFTTNNFITADIDADGDEDIFMRAGGPNGVQLYFIENIGPVANTPPTAADQVLLTSEDTPYAFFGANFGFLDADAGDVLQAVQIVTLPEQGTWELNGNPITAGQIIQVAELAGLIFQAEPNAYSPMYASFTYKVYDGQLWSLNAYNMLIHVAPVNDAPLTTDAMLTGQQDMALVLSGAYFPFADVDANPLADVQIISLPNVGTLQLSGTNGTVGQVIPAAQLTQLTFTPAAGQFGLPYTSFQFAVGDGQAFSAPATMVINIEQASVAGDTWPEALVRLSPNPAVEIITVEVTANGFGEPVEAKFFDAQGCGMGQLQLQSAGLSANGKMDVGKWAPGMYFIKIQAGVKMKTMKFSKK